MIVIMRYGLVNLWLSLAVLVVLLFFIEGTEKYPKGKRNVTAMDAVVNANSKQDSLTQGTQSTDDMVFPKITSSSGSRDYSAATRLKRSIWPNGRIYYKIDRNIRIRPNHMRVIKAAMAEWERNTCIRFIDKTHVPAFREYVNIYYGIGCRGSVGRWRGMKSLLSLGPRCDDFRVVLHELGHTIGYFHEQNRPDRNKYVEVLWKNINPRWKWAFYRKTRLVNSRGMPYDYNSIMHYGLYTYSINGKPTLKPRDPSIKYLGNTGLSLMDIKQTNVLYNCIDIPKFPEDFYFTKGISKNIARCITMNEPNDPSWNDTNICYNKDKKDIKLTWSNSGPVPSMYCTNTAMPNRLHYARYWKDNYLCVPRDSVLRFNWSYSGPIGKMKCTGIRVHPGSPYLYHLCAVRTDTKINNSNRTSIYTPWSPWHPCNKDCGGGRQSRFRQCKRGRTCSSDSLVETRLCNNNKCSSWPHWPLDFKYHIGYIKPIHSCIRVFERNQYSQWLKNWFCWAIMRKRKVKILWSDMNEVPGMRCTQITEPRENRNSGWDNNYMCVQNDAPYRFQWSSNGVIRGLHCVKWMGKGGKDGWDNNYLCAKEYPEKTGCPNGWVVNRTTTDDYCYLLEKKGLTWPEAKKACQKHKASLLSLKNEEENRFVRDKVQKRTSVWIGANDRKTEGSWQWTDGTSATLSSKWDRNEPNNGGRGSSNEDCALMRFDGVWNDYPCEEYPFPYICKMIVPRSQLNK